MPAPVLGTLLSVQLAIVRRRLCENLRSRVCENDSDSVSVLSSAPSSEVLGTTNELGGEGVLRGDEDRLEC
jgi:hypothetical protein